MKFFPRMLAFVVVFTAALMAVNEMPELLTLTDNVSNDYVSVRIGSESLHPGVVKSSTRETTAASVVFSLPVRSRIAATASNFLLFSCREISSQPASAPRDPAKLRS